MGFMTFWGCSNKQNQQKCFSTLILCSNEWDKNNKQDKKGKNKQGHAIWGTV
jgi:hypothetical protein